MSVVPTLRIRSRLPLVQVLKTAIAAIAAWVIAITIIPGQLPVFAAIAAILVVQPSVNQSFGKALERSFGVITGVVLATIIGIVFGHSAWIVLLAIVLAILLGWVLRLGPGSANQIPISAMLVLSIGAATPDYALARIIETVLGAGIGLLVNVVLVAPVLLAPARAAVTSLALSCADALEHLATALSRANTDTDLESLLNEARALKPLREAAIAAVKQGDDSLLLNPRRSKHRDELERQRVLLRRLEPVVTRTLGMARSVHDHDDPTLHEEPTVADIAVELGRAAHDLRLLVTNPPAPGEPEPTTAEIPALTAPLVIFRPHPEHWILIGSLMEDLRRVREEIVGETT
ncbi:MAG TPA: aromatic acid exporter family protein [Plantibacter sp.]|uniref:FUSC family protein n=1 Tax=unclassified Plantibacter TaxID=2624265 RepID=UPI002BAC3387|nr:aromatic acid exporter family protein [Plantibacter sp.]